MASTTDPIVILGAGPPVGERSPAEIVAQLDEMGNSLVSTNAVQ